MRDITVGIFQPAGCDLEPPARLSTLADTLAAHGDGLDLLVCPELFLSGYNVGDKVAARAQPADGPFATGAAALARKHGVALVYGYPEAATDGHRYNSALAIGADGRTLANHRKLALPSAYESALFSTHAGIAAFDLHGWRVAMLVCYDVEFPETVRAAVLAGAELVVAPTALSAQWDVVARKLIPTRAFENNVCLAYANHAGSEGDLHYLGESRIVGADGRELAVATAQETVIRARLSKEPFAALRARLPYVRDCRALELQAGEEAACGPPRED